MEGPELEDEPSDKKKKKTLEHARKKISLCCHFSWSKGRLFLLKER